ncbi:protein PIF-like [Mya arenaria]|uniref:protein PIF-like n=1 Tax=Mya arenaria TaxID=6604 RepID=UPI0022E9719D|nr:protein PIF-like [Mya arenaria]XP_052815953.1 protein PIF-like [Mya arenaria]
MTSSNSVHILFVLAVARVVPGQIYNADCDENTVKLRAGYKEHPTDCSKYIRCLLNEEGQYAGKVRACGYGTYWNQTFLTCILAKDTVCKHDVCYQQPDGNRRKLHGNCRGFYECQGNSSKPRCCPLGQYFHDSLVCINNTVDIACNQRCSENVLYTHTNDPFGESIGGPLTQPSPSQGETGWRENSGINRQTPVDRTVKSDANSDTGDLNVKPIVSSVKTNQVQTSICTPIIHLPFTLDDKDQSGNAYQIINHNVIVQNGKAIFNGKDNFLSIPIFPSLNITTSLAIKVIYSSDHESIPRNRLRTIFSNDGCNEVPSVYMYENLQYIFGGVGTQPDADMSEDTQVQQRNHPTGQQSSTKDVMYIFHDGEFTLINGNRSQFITAKGNLNKIACPLRIGYGADILPFKGEIDEFTVYMCQDV